MNRWQVESLDNYGYWTPESNGTYETEADALAAIESVIATCGWDRDRLRAVEVSE